jgi:hypothetical protein
MAERGLDGRRAVGEIDSVNQAFQPEGRFCASNSQYAFKPRKACVDPIGKMYPICGPTAKTRDSKQPTRSPEPPSQLIWS